MCNLIFCFILCTTFSIAQAAGCPWINKTGRDFLNFNYEPGKVVNLSQEQIRDVLSCLKIVLSQFYAYHIIYPENEIVSRVQNAILDAKPMSSSEFLNQIFSFHSGYADLHLSYQGGNVYKRFEKLEPIAVKLSEELAEEQIYERPKYTYFKPGKLVPSLTTGQSAFVDYIF